MTKSFAFTKTVIVCNIIFVNIRIVLQVSGAHKYEVPGFGDGQSPAYLKFQHAHCDLEEDDGALVKKQIPNSQQNLQIC